MLGLRGLLRCGASGAVLFVLVFLVNDHVKPDYDWVRDYVSEAAVGRGGGVQIANFLVSGALIAASSVALTRVVSRWTGWLVRVFGIGLMVVGVFVSDRVPTGRPTWHGNVHNVVSILVFASLAAACFTAARWRPTIGWRWYSWVTGVGVPVLFVLTDNGGAATGLLQRLTIVVGWGWLVALTMRAAGRDTIRPSRG